MTENRYQADVIKKIRRMFPGCVILKNDTDYIQGILDITILWKEFWGMLEFKKDRNSSLQPNQEYYLELLNRMHFARIIYPEIEEEVLSALEQAFTPSRRTRISKS